MMVFTANEPLRQSSTPYRGHSIYLADDALDAEFTLAAAVIEARVQAGLTQAELAKRLDTTQSVIARLEGGRVMPTTRTLEKIARATGSRLKISFEPNAKAPSTP